MKNLEVIKIIANYKSDVKDIFYEFRKYPLFIDKAIILNDGYMIASYHPIDCCELHYLDFEHITLEEFNGLKFDLSNENFFKRIPNYGIELIPSNGHSIKIPGYGNNNGYYNDKIYLLVIKDNEILHYYNITDCQKTDS